MKNISVDQKEAKRILLMHKFLIAEQSNSTQDTGEGVIDNLISVRCLKGGEKIRSKKTGKVFYRKKLKSGNTLRQYSDMTFTVTDSSGKIIKTAKFNCDSYVNTSQNNSAQIELLKKDNWKTKEEMSGIPDSQLENKSMYEKNTDYGVTLYRSLLDSDKPSEYSPEQKEFIDYYKKEGFYPKNEFSKQIQTAFTKEDCITPDVKYLFSKEFQVCKDPNSKLHSNTTNVSTTSVDPSDASTETPEAELDDEETKRFTKYFNRYGDSTFARQVYNQTRNDRQACKKEIELYYMAWYNKVKPTEAAFRNQKSIAQQCVNQHRFNKIQGMFTKSDNYINTLTGRKPHPNLGPDSKWRLSAPIRD
jgi:hypothetical protein